MHRRAMYVSKALLPEDRDGQIYLPSRISNRRNDICGTLHRDGDRFVQVLEGPHDAVEALLAKIRHDPRHTDFTLRVDEQTPARVFGEWSMSYTNRLDGAWQDWAQRHGAEGDVFAAPAPQVMRCVAELAIPDWQERKRPALRALISSLAR